MAQKLRSTWNYTPQQKEALKISRSRLQLFLDCERCFWLVMRRRVKRPSTADYVLNMTVDLLLKKEFDVYRQQAKPHPLMKKYKLKMIPFAHDDLEKWRNPFEGVQYWHEEHNFLLFGGIDDVWQNEKDQLVVVDYKATAKDQPVTELYEPGSYHDSYRRQMEVYHWLLSKNDFSVSPMTYFVYATAIKKRDDFAKKLNFDLNLIAYQAKTDWIAALLPKIKTCLDGDLPKYRQEPACAWCDYVWQRIKAAQPEQAAS